MHLMGSHAVPGSLIPVPGTWYPVPSQIPWLLQVSLPTQMHLRVADKVQVGAQLRPPRCSLALANSNPVNVIVVAALIVVVFFVSIIKAH